MTTTDKEKGGGFDLEKWEKDRWWMYLNFCVGAYAFGLSLTAYYPTEYYYFKDFMKIENADLFYGLSWAFLCGSGVTTSLIGSYYADSTKDVRYICLLTNIINVIGNIMYVLYYSPYLVLFGQLLIGTAAARMVAGVGEISRVYDSQEITQKLSFLGIFSTIGSVTGPCTAFIFQYVDTDIFGWKLNIGNMIGVSMAILYMLQFILNYFTLKNVSKDYTLKKSSEEKKLLSDENENESEEEEIQNDGNQNEDISFQEKYILALKTLILNKHIIFLFAVCFFATYARATISLLQPIKTVEYLHWRQIDLATFMILSTCIGAIPTALMITLLARYIDDFFLFLFTLTSLLVALILMGLLPMTVGVYKSSKIIMYSSGILASVASAGFQILSRSMVAKFVPENIQTVTEAIRNGLFELSYMLTGLLVKLPSTYLTQTMFAMAIVLSIAMAWFIVEEKSFRKIQEIKTETPETN